MTSQTVIYVTGSRHLPLTRYCTASEYAFRTSWNSLLPVPGLSQWLKMFGRITTKSNRRRLWQTGACHVVQLTSTQHGSTILTVPTVSSTVGDYWSLHGITRTCWLFQPSIMTGSSLKCHSSRLSTERNFWNKSLSKYSLNNFRTFEVQESHKYDIEYNDKLDQCNECWLSHWFTAMKNYNEPCLNLAW